MAVYLQDIPQRSRGMVNAFNVAARVAKGKRSRLTQPLLAMPWGARSHLGFGLMEARTTNVPGFTSRERPHHSTRCRASA